MSLNQINKLKKQYDSLKIGKEDILKSLFKSEIPKAVYNSNAIENSTLTISETKKILSGREISRNVSMREILEVKNLAKVLNYINDKVSSTNLNKKLILYLHQMLMGNINKQIAGRFRKNNEYINLGTHITPAPELIERMIDNALQQYLRNKGADFLEKISLFHLKFEHMHPFVDGNGRIGRVILNYQLMKLGFPPVIIYFKNKAAYFAALRKYSTDKKAEPMIKILDHAVSKSLRKRISCLGREIN